MGRDKHALITGLFLIVFVAAVTRHYLLDRAF